MRASYDTQVDGYIKAMMAKNVGDIMWCSNPGYDDIVAGLLGEYVQAQEGSDAVLFGRVGTLRDRWTRSISGAGPITTTHRLRRSCS